MLLFCVYVPGDVEEGMDAVDDEEQSQGSWVGHADVVVGVSVYTVAMVVVVPSVVVVYTGQMGQVHAENNKPGWQIITNFGLK